MANTVKTLQGEILASEIEAVNIDNSPTVIQRSPMLPTKVTVVGKSGIKYDVTSSMQGVQAIKVYAALLNFIAGTGHTAFDPTQAK